MIAKCLETLARMRGFYGRLVRSIQLPFSLVLL